MASAKQIAWRKKFARMSKAGKFKKSKTKSNPPNSKQNGHKSIFESYWNQKVHPMGSSPKTMATRKALDPDGYERARKKQA